MKYCMKYCMKYYMKYCIVTWGILLCGLAGCSGMQYTTDDGRKVDEKLLANIRVYGRGEAAIRPAIVKSAQLHDPDCSTQWELPFAVATSYGLPNEDDKIAWVRGLQVDERLTVIGVSPVTGMMLGDKIMRIDGHHDDDATKMAQRLYELRDEGDPFQMTMANGKMVTVKPVKVCRGHVLVAEPVTPDRQDYHWRESTHPLQVFAQGLTPDEAMWVVLWTQGISEEGGFRMKTYHYGMSLAKTAITVASIASGVGGAIQAGQLAVAQASQVAAAAAASVTASVAEKAATQALVSAAEQQATQLLTNEVATLAIRQGETLVASAAANAAVNQANLSGVSWVASTVFDKADKWAFERMEQLGADPLAGFGLEMKLAHVKADQNAFVLDDARLRRFVEVAKAHDMSRQVAAILAGTPLLPVKMMLVRQVVAASGKPAMAPVKAEAPEAQTRGWQATGVDTPDDPLAVSRTTTNPVVPVQAAQTGQAASVGIPNPGKSGMVSGGPVTVQ